VGRFRQRLGVADTSPRSCARGSLTGSNRLRVEGDKRTDQAEIQSSRSRAMPHFGSEWAGRPRLNVGASGSALDCQVRGRLTLHPNSLRCVGPTRASLRAIRRTTRSAQGLGGRPVSRAQSATAGRVT
jgi:hypothetical protein